MSEAGGGDGGSGTGTGGAGTGGDGTGAGGAGGDGGAGSGGDGATEWTAGLSEEMQGVVGSKGWGSVGDVISSYRELESMRGVPAERLLKLPGEGASPEEWGEVFAKLGRPENAEGYKPPEGIEVSEPRMKAFAQKAFELGLNEQQAQALMTWDNQFMGETTAQGDTVFEEQARTDLSNLRKEWGAGFDRKMTEVDAAQNEFGLDAEDIRKMDKTWGREKTIRFLSEVGSRVSESTFEGDDRGGKSGDRGFNSATPAEARSRIADLNADPEFKARYLKGEKTAVQRMNDLHRMAAGG